MPLKRKITLLSVIRFGENRLERFVLLGPKGSSIADVVGKQLLMYSGTDNGIGELWLRHELTKAGHEGKLSDHFRSVTRSPKQDKIILPTFLEKPMFV